MKYSIDERGVLLVNGEYISGLSTQIDVAYRNAAVEFWTELQKQQEQITRLTAEREELLAARRAALEGHNEYTIAILEQAIARCESGEPRRNVTADHHELLAAVNDLLIAEATNFGGPKFQAAFQRLEELAVRLREAARPGGEG